MSQTAAADGTAYSSLEPDPRRWSILAVVVISQLMVVLDASIVTIALPSAQRALHISVANRQWVITAYTLAFGGFLLLGGRIADFGGRKRMFMIGLVGFAGASALGGLSNDQTMLLPPGPCRGAWPPCPSSRSPSRRTRPSGLRPLALTVPFREPEAPSGSWPGVFSLSTPRGAGACS
jgi:hypothetical protein